MPFVESNKDGIEIADYRRSFDRIYERTVWRLGNCYYGDEVADRPDLVGKFSTWKNGKRFQNGWVHGVSNPWVAKRGPSKNPILRYDWDESKAWRIQRIARVWTPSELTGIATAKALFDKLHGQIWDEYEIAMQDDNEAKGRAGREKVYDRIRDKDRQFDDQDRELLTRKSDEKKVSRTSEKAGGIEVEPFDDEA